MALVVTGAGVVAAEAVLAGVEGALVVPAASVAVLAGVVVVAAAAEVRVGVGRAIGVPGAGRTGRWSERSL